MVIVMRMVHGDENCGDGNDGGTIHSKDDGDSNGDVELVMMITKEMFKMLT